MCDCLPLHLRFLLNRNVNYCSMKISHVLVLIFLNILLSVVPEVAQRSPVGDCYCLGSNSSCDRRFLSILYKCCTGTSASFQSQMAHFDSERFSILLFLERLSQFVPNCKRGI